MVFRQTPLLVRVRLPLLATKQRRVASKTGSRQTVMKRRVRIPREAARVFPRDNNQRRRPSLAPRVRTPGGRRRGRRRRVRGVVSVGVIGVVRRRRFGTLARRARVARRLGRTPPLSAPSRRREDAVDRASQADRLGVGVGVFFAIDPIDRTGHQAAQTERVIVRGRLDERVEFRDRLPAFVKQLAKRVGVDAQQRRAVDSRADVGLPRERPRRSRE